MKSLHILMNSVAFLSLCLVLRADVGINAPTVFEFPAWTNKQENVSATGVYTDEGGNKWSTWYTKTTPLGSTDRVVLTNSFFAMTNTANWVAMNGKTLGSGCLGWGFPATTTSGYEPAYYAYHKSGDMMKELRPALKNGCAILAFEAARAGVYKLTGCAFKQVWNPACGACVRVIHFNANHDVVSIYDSTDYGNANTFAWTTHLDVPQSSYNLKIPEYRMEAGDMLAFTAYPRDYRGNTVALKFSNVEGKKSAIELMRLLYPPTLCIVR